MQQKHPYIFEANAWDDYSLQADAVGTQIFWPNSVGRRVYNPAREPALVSSFAKLGHLPRAWKQEQQVFKRFLVKFGALGDKSGTILERSEDSTVGAQAVGELEYHAMMCNVIMQLTFEQQEKSTTDDLALRCFKYFSALPMQVILPAHGGLRVGEKDGGRYSAFFTSALSGVNRACINGQSVFSFKNLLQLIYWRLKDSLEQMPMRRCKACSCLFFVSDNRQNYCPPLPQSRESECGRRKLLIEPIEVDSDRDFAAWLDAGWEPLRLHWPRLAASFA